MIGIIVGSIRWYFVLILRRMGRIVLLWLLVWVLRFIASCRCVFVLRVFPRATAFRPLGAASTSPVCHYHGASIVVIVSSLMGRLFVSSDLVGLGSALQMSKKSQGVVDF